MKISLTLIFTLLMIFLTSCSSAPSSSMQQKIINLNDNSVCYLTKIELEILKHLIRTKETSKNYVKENILKIKSNIETNSLESHLTRIRKKMNKVNTAVKIQTKNEKLSITI